MDNEDYKVNAVIERKAEDAVGANYHVRRLISELNLCARRLRLILDLIYRE